MKQIPILFSTQMVQAILDSRKTQTRRVVKPQPPTNHEYLGTDTDRSSGEPILYACWEGSTFHNVKCPYGQPGDVLWMRETWTPLVTGGPKGFNLYGYKTEDLQDVKWKPSIHMPKEAARIWLEITSVRVERLQDISEEDAEREGIELVEHNCFKNYDEKDPYQFLQDPIGSFQSLWQSINGKESWDANPWVWVIEFKRVQKPDIFDTIGKIVGQEVKAIYIHM